MKNTKSAMVANRPGWRVSEQVDRKGNITRILIEPGARRTAGNRRTPCGQRSSRVQALSAQQMRTWAHRLHEQADASNDVGERMELLRRADIIAGAAELEERQERRAAAARVSQMAVHGILLDH